MVTVKVWPVVPVFVGVSMYTRGVGEGFAWLMGIMVMPRNIRMETNGNILIRFEIDFLNVSTLRVMY